VQDAQRFAEIFPGLAEAHGWVGDACRRRHRTAEAEQSFRRSLEVEPGYEWGRLALADLLIDAARTAEADTLLAAAEPTPALLLRRIRSATAQRRAESASEALAALLKADNVDDTLLRQAREALGRRPRILEQAVASIANEADPPARLGAFWMEWLASRRDWRGANALLKSLRSRPAVRQAALAPLVRGLRAHRQTWRLKRLMRRERERLRADDFLWALTGHAVSLSDDRAALRWLSDWPRRRVTPWVLNVIALGMRRFGRDQEALQVSRRALELAADEVTGCHRAWVGVECALDGDAEEARRLLGSLQVPQDVTSFYDGLAALGQAVLAMRRGEGTPQTRFAEARRRLSEAGRLFGSGNRYSARLRRRATARIADLRGGPVGWLWRFVQW